MAKDKIIWSLNRDNERKPLQINTLPVKKSFSERHKTLSYLLVGLSFSLAFGFLILPTETGIDTCFTSTFCINSLVNPILYSLYLGFIVFAILAFVVLTYELLVKLSRTDYQLTAFAVLFIAIAIITVAIWYFSNDEIDRERTKLLPVITSIISLSGLLLIWFRKKN